MLSENLINKIKTIIENTVNRFNDLHSELPKIYEKYKLFPPNITNISSDLSHQIEKSIVQDIKDAAVGKGFEDILFKNKLMLEIKVSSLQIPYFSIANTHKCYNKTYILVNHRNCILKNIFILPYARDKYFYPPGKNSQSRRFNYTTYKHKVIKFKY